MKTMALIFLTLLLAGLQCQPAAAQEGDFTLHLRRDFGYGGGSNIRGTFTINLVGDDARVASVIFLIDGEEMAAVEAAPFRYQFHTDDYGFGTHRLTASVQLTDGGSQTTPALQYNFVSPGEQGEQVTTILVGIGGAIIIALALVALIQMLMTRGKPPSNALNAKPRSYGLLGATICPKCGRAYSRHIWGMNLVVGRLDRCTHCGKWAMTVRATPQAVRLAEEMEDGDVSEPVERPDLDAHDRKALDETKYFDDI